MNYKKMMMDLDEREIDRVSSVKRMILNDPNRTESDK